MYVRKALQSIEQQVKRPRSLIQVISGPRQVGKTTLAQQLTKRITTKTLYVSADDTIVADVNWLDGIWQSARDTMRVSGERELLLIIDEIQKITNWSQAVKKNWDRDDWDNLNLKVIILGSSRLLLQEGLNESLMGRFFLHYVGQWSYEEMHNAFQVTPEQYAWFGGYPRAIQFIEDEALFKEYVRNAIVEPSISRDILMLTQVNKPALLRQLFEMGSAYSGQILSYNKILGQLQEAGNSSTLAHYAELLRQASLVAGLEEYSSKPIKSKASSPKFQVFDMALLSSLRRQTFEQAQADSAYWGRVVESTVGARLLNLVSQNSLGKLLYWRKDNREVDFVIQLADQIAAIEVKSTISNPAPENLAAFKKQFPGAKTLLVGDSGLPWQDFLHIENLEQLF
jgi:predicted AAA+ superfamily ATPase